MAKQLNVALLGYQFMGKAHSNAFRQVSRYFPEIGAEPVLKCLVGRNRDAVTAAATEYGFEEVDTNWRRAVNRDDIDIVDICTPGKLHAEMAIEALKAGKHVICEKPLTNTLAEAREILKVAKKSNKKTLTAYNYRRVPAIALAKQLIKEGKNAINWTRLSCHSFRNNAVRLQLHALAYNLGNFLRTLALPEAVEHWSLTTLREKLIKIGAKVVRHGRYITFQMAEVAIPRPLFAEILRLIDGLRPAALPP